MANESNNGGVLGPAFTTPRATPTSPIAAPICDVANELPLGDYEKSDQFTVVVNSRSGSIYLLHLHPAGVHNKFSVVAPPTENQVIGL